MRRNNSKPDFLRGNSALRTDMFLHQVTLGDVQERIKNEFNYNIPISAISNILDEKLCNFVKDIAREMCYEISKPKDSKVS